MGRAVPRTKIRWAIAGGLLVVMSCVAFATAQDWSAKPFNQWSKAEVDELLNDSPWARKQEVLIRYGERQTTVAGGTNPAQANGGFMRSEGNTAALGGARAAVDFTFTLRLRSALPVREALVRLKQLEAHYDQMSPKERATFDAKMKGLLECPGCVNNYVLTLSSKSKENPGADAVYTVFAAAKLADIKRYITIGNDRGERRELVYFVAPRVPGDEATFFFPRLDEKGAPLLTASSKELIFNITNNEVNMITNFKIDVSKLVINGHVEF
jgi:hypothetical protein